MIPAYSRLIESFRREFDESENSKSSCFCGYCDHLHDQFQPYALGLG